MSKKLRSRLIVGVTVTIVVVLAIVKYFQISKAMAQNANFQPPPEAITSSTVREIAWPDVLTAVGSVQAVQGAVLSAEEDGKVAEVLFQSGANVEAGQVLLRLDTAVEEAKLKGAEAVLEQSTKAYTRSQNLRKQNALSQSDFEKAESEYVRARADVESLRATITRKRVVAPFAGKTGIRKANVGEYVRAGTELVPLYSVDPVFVNFTLPQQNVAKVHTDQTVEVSLDTSPVSTFAGKITAVDPQVQPTTRAFAVQATFEKVAGALRPGMFVQTLLTLPGDRKSAVIPVTAISYAPYGDFVYLIEDGKSADGEPVKTVRTQTVRVGEKRGNLASIVDGLKPGQEVATSGLFKLRPGATVFVNNDFAPAETLNPTPEDT